MFSSRIGVVEPLNYPQPTNFAQNVSFTQQVHYSQTINYTPVDHNINHYQNLTNKDQVR